MATLGEDVFDYVYTPYNPYPSQYLSNRPKGWRQRYYYGDPTEYFENYQRAQLKAILSQVNPNLTPRMRKANTKDVGVQVNPKIDAAVQCSLGPRTLLRTSVRGRGNACKRPASRNQPQGSAASMPRAVRFRRTTAIYSPIVSPNLGSFIWKRDPDTGNSELQESQEPPAPGGGKEESEGRELGPARGPETPGVPDGSGSEEPEQSGKEEAEVVLASREKKLRFQFLEQKYGYFHCKDCDARWESAYVWCVQSTNKVYFKQFCRSCEKAYNPYRVEDIACQN
ncbi:zygote arrest protein 1 isoform X2 [Narcine bancroftii]|uniref:zygote arrest protein 1 isoform X2 n=1 Tax=Narcine bancroftii TaxID=1343680 RepID=UPI003832115F